MRFPCLTFSFTQSLQCLHDPILFFFFLRFSAADVGDLLRVQKNKQTSQKRKFLWRVRGTFAGAICRKKASDRHIFFLCVALFTAACSTNGINVPSRQSRFKGDDKKKRTLLLRVVDFSKDKYIDNNQVGGSR